MVKLTGKIQRLIITILVISGCLAGCNAPASPTVAPTQPIPVLSSPTLTHTPIPSLTFTPAPTATPSLTPTLTYLPITPALQGTSVPGTSGIISATNADRLTRLARWGLGNPNDLVYTPDGRYLIAACATGVYFYDPADYALVRQIDTLDRALHLAVSPDSQLLAVAGPAQVYLYQTSDFQLLNTFPAQANSLDFSPDGQVLAIGISTHPDTLQFWDIRSGEILRVFESDMGIWSVDFAPQGGFIASAGNSTKVWSLDGTLTTDQGPYVSGGDTANLSFSPDGSLLAENTRSEIHIWRLLENGRLAHVRQINLTSMKFGFVHMVAFSPDGSMLAAALATGVYAWNLETGYRVFSAEAESHSFSSTLAWSMDSQQLARASKDFGVQVWDVRTEEQLALIQDQTGSYSALAWSPDGQLLAAGVEEGWAYLVNPWQGDLLQRLGSGYDLDSLAFSADGQTLALGYHDIAIELWTLDGAFSQLEGYFHYGSQDVEFSSDGQFFSAIASEDYTVDQTSVWNTLDWSIASRFSVGSSRDYRLTGFKLAPDLQTAAISIVDSTGRYDHDFIRIVTYPDGELVTTLEPHSGQYRAYIVSVAYSPSGEMLALLSEHYRETPHLRIWRTSDWQQLYTINVVPDQPRSGWASNQQDSLVWSPDSSLLAVGVEDGSLQVFDAAHGELLVTLPGHRMWATALAFSPDGRLLASCSLDGTIMLWGIR